MKRLAAILILLSPIVSLGQFYHPDPFKFRGTWAYSMEFNHEDIRQNNIGKVEVWTYELKEDSITIKDSLLDYTIVFNEHSLPVNYHSEHTMPVWWWPAFKRKIGLEKVRTDTFDYRFDYDSQNRLVHVSEYYYEGYGDGSYHQTDIWNKYGDQGLLVNQEIEEKYIFPPGYKYRGTPYPSDTERVSVQIVYEEDLVKNVYRIHHEDYDQFPNYKRMDTLDFNCSLDSVFLKRPLSEGTELDSLGRISKTTRFMKSVKPLGGGCFYVETENDVIYHHFYNRQSQKTRIEGYLRSGKHVSTELFEYKHGLLQKEWSSNSLWYTKYKYEKLPVAKPKLQ